MDHQKTNVENLNDDEHEDDMNMEISSVQDSNDNNIAQSNTSWENQAQKSVDPISKSTLVEHPAAPKPQPTSLRNLMYLCLSNNQDNLFHAIYSTTEEGKIYILYTQSNWDEALL